MALYHKSNKEIEQEYLLIKAAQQHPAAFAPLYERYYAQIRAYIFRRVQEDDKTSDITSQVFLKALHALPKYKFKGVPFAAFLYRIASNEINLAFRNNKQQELHIPFDRIPDILDDEDLEFEETKQSHLLLLKQSFEHLKDHEVELLEMYYFQDMSFREMGVFLGIKENNAKVKTKRVRDKLKSILEDRLKNRHE